MRGQVSLSSAVGGLVYRKRHPVLQTGTPGWRVPTAPQLPSAKTTVGLLLLGFGPGHGQQQQQGRPGVVWPQPRAHRSPQVPGVARCGPQCLSAAHSPFSRISLGNCRPFILPTMLPSLDSWVACD